MPEIERHFVLVAEVEIQPPESPRVANVRLSVPGWSRHVHHVAMLDRSGDLIGLANDAPGRGHPVPAGPALIEPLNDDRRDHADTPAQKIRHPRDVRILPPSRDFH